MLARSPFKRAFWGVFAISCLAHIAVFGLPLSQPPLDAEENSAVADSADASSLNAALLEGAQPIALTTLPSSAAVPPGLNDPQPVAAQQAIAPQPSLSQPLSAQALPVSPEAPIQPLPVQPLPEPVESVPPLSAPPVAVTPPLADPLPALPSDPELESPDSDPLEPGPPESTPPESGPPEPAMVVSLGANFPHLAGAQGNCYNLSSCYRLSDAGGYRQAARALTEQMKGQGYTVNEREDIEGAGRRVFEVVVPDQPNDTYFLNVFSDEAGSAVYVLTMDILTLDELQQLRA